MSTVPSICLIDCNVAESSTPISFGVLYLAYIESTGWSSKNCMRKSANTSSFLVLGTKWRTSSVVQASSWICLGLKGFFLQLKWSGVDRLSGEGVIKMRE